jgi:hypothetical protein
MSAGHTGICIKLDEWNITLEQEGPDNFSVRYGRQVRDHLDYCNAAHELGAVIMHALACDYRLDNRTPKEAYADEQNEHRADEELANR